MSVSRSQKKRSVLTDDFTQCYICGSNRWIEVHHIFGGSERKLSEKYGLTVPLCHQCHNEPPDGVHHNAGQMRWMHKIGQEAFEKTHSRDEFIQKFMRGSYL